MKTGVKSDSNMEDLTKPEEQVNPHSKEEGDMLDNYYQEDMLGILEEVKKVYGNKKELKELAGGLKQMRKGSDLRIGSDMLHVIG